MRGGAWEQRSFRLFFFGQGISAVGDRIFSVALAFAVLDLTGSVKDLGLVLAAQTVPLVLFLLMGGVWSDRLSRRAVILTSDLVAAGPQGASVPLPHARPGRYSSCADRHPERAARRLASVPVADLAMGQRPGVHGVERARF